MTKINKLFDYLKKNLKRIGRDLVIKTLTLYYCLIDSDTPAWAKSAIVGALLYLVSPFDAIPDFLLGGFVDDAGVLASALVAVNAHIKPEHIERANKQADILFGSAKTTKEYV